MLRFSKAARALVPQGTLAIFANRPLRGNRPIDLAVQAAYAAHVPELLARSIETNTPENFLGLFAAASEMGPAQSREYPWRAHYDARTYLDLLRTQSDHRLLVQERREALLNAIGAAIEDHGGDFIVDHVAVLCWARRTWALTRHTEPDEAGQSLP
jgi:hypothetical protein